MHAEHGDTTGFHLFSMIKRAIANVFVLTFDFLADLPVAV